MIDDKEFDDVNLNLYQKGLELDKIADQMDVKIYRFNHYIKKIDSINEFTLSTQDTKKKFPEFKDLFEEITVLVKKLYDSFQNESDKICDYLDKKKDDYDRLKEEYNSLAKTLNLGEYLPERGNDPEWTQSKYLGSCYDPIEPMWDHVSKG